MIPRWAGGTGDSAEGPLAHRQGEMESRARAEPRSSAAVETGASGNGSAEGLCAVGDPESSEPAMLTPQTPHTCTGRLCQRGRCVLSFRLLPAPLAPRLKRGRPGAR